MKEMIILITMFFADPSYAGKDSVSIHTYNGKPLVFTDVDKCEKWIKNGYNFMNIADPLSLGTEKLKKEITRLKKLDFNYH